MIKSKKIWVLNNFEPKKYRTYETLLDHTIWYLKVPYRTVGDHTRQYQTILDQTDHTGSYRTIPDHT